MLPKAPLHGVQLERTAFTAVVAWTAVLVAALVDMRIAANQRMIGALGGWVRRYEELQLGPAMALGWEAYLADQGFHPAVRLSGQVLTAILFGFSAALFLARSDRANDRPTALLSGSCAVLSILIFTVTAIRYGKWTNDSWAYAFVGLIGAILAGALAYQSQTDHQPQ